MNDISKWDIFQPIVVEIIIIIIITYLKLSYWNKCSIVWISFVMISSDWYVHFYTTRLQSFLIYQSCMPCTSITHMQR